MSRTGKFPLPSVIIRNLRLRLKISKIFKVSSHSSFLVHSSCNQTQSLRRVIHLPHPKIVNKFSPSLEAKRASPKCRQVNLTSVNFYHEIIGHKFIASHRLFIVAEAESSSTEKTTRRAVNSYILYSVRVFPLSFVSAMMLQNMLNLYSFSFRRK